MFRGSRVKPGKIVSTRDYPLQTFFWSDFTTRKDHDYTYRVVALRGRPGELEEAEEVSIRIQMDDEDKANHAIYFNRGVGTSQAYVRKFGNKKPTELAGREVWRWLSRGLFKSILDYIGQANSARFGLRAAVYEFDQGAVLKAFAKARDSGADVQIIYDARTRISQTNPQASKLEPARSNEAAIEAAGLTDCAIKRQADPNDISHNKFIVLLKDGEPVQVLTGSTNLTDGGIFGHSNCAHIVRDPRVAAKYLKYWKKLSTDPEMERRAEDDEIRPWNDENFPVPRGLPSAGSTTTIFSPRRTLEALQWYAERMDQAQTAVFLTAAFGVTDLFEEVLAKPKDYLRYVLLETRDEDMDVLIESPNNRVAVGNVLLENKFERWMAEQLTGLNLHVKYIHTKYMLLDPLSDDPLVITGSANFSDASTRRNDENMLVIRGDTRVADIYLGEFMRLFQHFYFRMIANASRAESRAAVSSTEAPRVSSTQPNRTPRKRGYLESSDRWRLPYYEAGTPKALERTYFAG